MKRLIAALLIAPLAWPQIPLGYSGVANVTGFTLISHNSGGSPDGTAAATTTLNTLGANLIIIATTGQFSTTAVSDTATNTWTPLTNYGGDDGVNFYAGVRFFYSYNPSTSSSDTFSASSGSGGSNAIAVEAFSGAAGSPFDQQNGIANQAVTATGSVTPSAGQNHELVIAVLGDSSGNASISSGFSVVDNQVYSGGAHYGIAVAYQIQTTLTTVNPTWSGSSPGGSATVATFKASRDAGGGGGITLLTHTSATTSAASTTLSTSATPISGSGANLIVVVLSFQATLSHTINDSSGNTYTMAGQNTSGDVALDIFYKCNPITTGTMTFTDTAGAADAMSLAVVLFSGTACPSSFQTATSNLCCTSSGGTFSPGAITAKLLVSTVGATSSTADAVGSGFTVIEFKAFGGGGVNSSISLAYLIQATATSQNPTWTVGTQTDLVGGGVGMAGFN